jgi:hypothetical protein
VFRFSDVFLVDASSANTIDMDLSCIARAKESGESAKDALTWLARQREEWLILFDNADDTTLNLREFFPRCSHGHILITTRNRDVCIHAGVKCKVSNMKPDDARNLLFSMASHEGDHSIEDGALANVIIQVRS